MVKGKNNHLSEAVLLLLQKKYKIGSNIKTDKIFFTSKIFKKYNFKFFKFAKNSKTAIAI